MLIKKIKGKQTNKKGKGVVVKSSQSHSEQPEALGQGRERVPCLHV